MPTSTDVRINLTANGSEVELTVPARRSLADLLREDLRLTGTHLGCEHGVCGACTVLLDGQPVRACITLAASCNGSAVTTVEGLEGPVVDALRETFRAEHGLQCGFCTPGMLVSAVDILNRLPELDEQRARLELSGNICRCTGYLGIVRALVRTAQRVHGEEPSTHQTATRFKGTGT